MFHLEQIVPKLSVWHMLCNTFRAAHGILGTLLFLMPPHDYLRLHSHQKYLPRHTYMTVYRQKRVLTYIVAYLPHNNRQQWTKCSLLLYVGQNSVVVYAIISHK